MSSAQVLALACLGLLIAGMAWLDSAPAAQRDAYTLQGDEHGMVLHAPDGRVVLRYMTKKPAETNLSANSVCCLYPVYTPSGVRAVDFAPGDHRHHRGIFLAWHATTCGTERADFWGWGQWAPTADRVIRNRGVELAKATSDEAVLEVRNDWTIGPKTVIEEQSTITVRAAENAYVIDWEFRLTPTVDVKLDHTAFGGFCVKGRKEGKAEYHDSDGKVALPDPHHLKPETDWPSKPWYDYVIKLDEGETIGVAVIDHKDNPKSLWHNLGPIAMVNPCIVAPGEVTFAQGKTVRLRYRVVVHDGPTPTALLDRLAAEWR